MSRTTKVFMFNLTKRTEYGLMALIYLSGKKGQQPANTGEIAQSASVPRELLAKILSELARAGLVDSYSGPQGGFCLARPASQVSLNDILSALEKKPGLIDCVSGKAGCHRSDDCTIRTPLTEVHRKVSRILKETTLTDIMSPNLG